LKCKPSQTIVEVVVGDISWKRMHFLNLNFSHLFKNYVNIRNKTAGQLIWWGL